MSATKRTSKIMRDRHLHARVKPIALLGLSQSKAPENEAGVFIQKTVPRQKV